MSGFRVINNMMPLLLAMAVAIGMAACSKSQDKLLALNPDHVANRFFETWKKEDWKALYGLVDPAFMRSLRTQKLSPELARMSDEELFVHEFREARRQNPGKVLSSYRIEHITPYTRGDTTLWLYAVVNGRKKKIAISLDGLSLKIDLTRIEDVPEGTGRQKQP